MPIAFNIPEAVEQSGVGRSTLYAEIAAGRLVARKCGRRTVILAADLQEWLANLPTVDRQAKMPARDS